MRSLLQSLLIASSLSLLVPVAASAQVQARAYAPENLRTLSRADQTRVISLEYSEQSRGRSIPDDQLRFYLDQVNRSSWTFSQIKSDIARSLSGSGQWPGPGPLPGPGMQTIRCESTGNRLNTCRTPWQGASRLVRQLSSSGCQQGRDWNSRNGEVWVNHGCRGEFARLAMNTYSVTCSSHGSRPTSCAWDRSQGRPYLLQRLSNSACTEGRTWGYNPRQGLWVSGGCRARFGAR